MPVADDLADAALAVDGVEQPLLLRVDRQIDVVAACAPG